jgi:hypothetical protein
MNDLIKILFDSKCQVDVITTKMKQTIMTAYIEAANKSGSPFQIAIETGTLYGETSLFLSDHFEKVYTIESYQPLYEEAVKKLSIRQNIECVYGDSGLTLSKILKDISPDRKILFWLDAHFSGEGTGLSSDGSTCPTFRELISISSILDTRNSAILIDDSRCFGDSAYSHYPNQNWVLEWGRMQGLKANISSGMFHLVAPDIRRELCHQFGITY